LAGANTPAYYLPSKKMFYDSSYWFLMKNV
jgi:hypothetical protein